MIDKVKLQVLLERLMLLCRLDQRNVDNDLQKEKVRVEVEIFDLLFKDGVKMQIRKFWIVLIEGNKIPEMGFHAHYTLHDAEEEAARLIREENKPAVIMQSVLKGEVKHLVPPIVWIDL